MTLTEESAYQVQLEVFQGPFDLLLKAIDEGEIPIHSVSLEKVTATYCDYWRREMPNLILAADFVYLAAVLLEKKSRAVLPGREEVSQTEELAEIEESLVLHLQEYQLFKNVAQNLRARKQIFEKFYGRHEGEEVEGEISLVEVSLRDLVVAFRKVYKEAAEREKIFAITREEITLEERIAEIKELIAGRSAGVYFEELFIRKTRLEVVVTFLAILELIKQKNLKVTQDRRYGQILIFERKGEAELNGEPTA